MGKDISFGSILVYMNNSLKIFDAVKILFRIGMSDGGLVTEAKPPVKWNKVTTKDIQR